MTCFWRNTYIACCVLQLIGERLLLLYTICIIDILPDIRPQLLNQVETLNVF